jgi:hypothetical protein
MMLVPGRRHSIQNRKRIKGGIVDIAAILSELKRERDRLNRAIAALEGTDGARIGSKRSASPTLVIRKAKKGRHLTAEGRKRLSEMMKKRWAERRRKSTASRKAA